MAVGGGGQSVEALVGYFGWGGKYEALLQWRTTVLAFKCWTRGRVKTKMWVTSGKREKVVVAGRCLFFTWPDFDTEMNAWSCIFFHDPLESCKNRVPPPLVYWFVIYLWTVFQLGCYRNNWYLKDVNCEWEGVWREPGVCQEATANVLTEYPRCFWIGMCLPVRIRPVAAMINSQKTTLPVL
jgi:hypothetical protein